MNRSTQWTIGGLGILVILAFVVVTAGTPSALANPPGVEDGLRKVFGFNLIGHPNEYTGGCGEGHRIFVDRNAKHAHIVVRHDAGDGWHIEDCNATARGGRAELHAQETGEFYMYVRILGKPGGTLDICTDLLEDHSGFCAGGNNELGECITDSDCTGGGVCDLGENAHLCGIGTVYLKREGGKSSFSLETDELFADDLEDVMWNVTTENFRIAQFRVYVDAAADGTSSRESGVEGTLISEIPDIDSSFDAPGSTCGIVGMMSFFAGLLGLLGLRSRRR